MKIPRRLFFFFVILAVAALVTTSGGKPTSGAAKFGLILFAATSLTILSLRFTRTISLRDRRVSRRLTVLLTFATVVPALLMWGLGAVASWLGSASDRAMAAANAYRDESRRLEDELAVALGSESESPDAKLASAVERLQDVASIHARRGEDLSIWWHEGTEWNLVAGDSVLRVAPLSGWISPADSTRTIAIVEGRPYVAARAAAPDGQIALALLPADGVVGDSIAARLAAPLRLPRYELKPAAGDRAAPGWSVDIISGSPFAGFAAIPARIWTGSEWRDTQQYLSAHTPFLPSLGGLVRNARITPIAAIPIFFVGLFLLLGIRILVVNGQTLGAIGRSITSAVGALRGGVEALRAGRLDHRIAVEGSDELWDVAAAFNEAAEGLERGRRVELEQARLRGDLELARRIQTRLLPAETPSVPGLEIAGVSLPAREVGGDYFDHVPLGDGRVALVLADVSGKGVPAALLMSAFRASLLAQLDSHSDPAAAMANVNRFLHRSVEPGRFVTAFLAIVDGRDGRIDYCNAGHNPPFLVNGAGAPTPLETGGLLLGMMEDAAYDRGEVCLEAGQTLAIYSDGAVEAKDTGDSMWGEDRLVAQIRSLAGVACSSAAATIASEIRAFEGEAGASDDLTLLLARRRGGERHS